MPLFANVIIAVALQTAVVPVRGGYLSACFKKYPEYDGKIDASDGSKVQIRFKKENPAMTFKFRGKGLEKDCVKCGVHIHSGTTCADHASVGGHYWNQTSDPWTTENGAVYNTNSEGMSKNNYKLDSGYDLEQNFGHAVVVHDQDGDRIGCGVLSKGKKAAKKCKAKKKKTTLTACITKLPQYKGDLEDVGGYITVVFNRDQLKFSWYIRGSDRTCKGCGMHIHSGTTCEDVGGHYWDDNGSIDDPWSTSGDAKYSAVNGGQSSSGVFTVKSGYSAQENLGHAVVVHDSNNKPYGCGVLYVGKPKICEV